MPSYIRVIDGKKLGMQEGNQEGIQFQPRPTMEIHPLQKKLVIFALETSMEPWNICIYCKFF